ncbi:cysteine desulfurase [Arthrobacter alpinus]|uniref:Cysteine desulfurase n=1 Tax=Arthrobacter alpinus TaxID=656366 RepID=A0A0M4QG08_9MICC|nr:cysteine desulfurase family protein [Arthrobacter alpinus]ALE92542.1 cysteine desulfurase [Arthrobacter alpinus]
MIFLDAAATTPVRREVIEAMFPFLTNQFGNPSSHHELGEQAANALESAREKCATVLGCHPEEITFTASGTEADNLALKGIALARRAADPRLNRVLISAIEHPAIAESADYLRRIHGFVVEVVPVDSDGLVVSADFARMLGSSTADSGVAAAGAAHAAGSGASPALSDPAASPALSDPAASDVAVASIMYANNEVGTIQDIPALAAVARKHGVPLHSDAVQGAGWLELDVANLGVAALSISGHKLGAPKGVGLLYVRGDVPLEPLLHGGGQERGNRSGTQNVAFAVALATALRFTEAGREAAVVRATVLRDDFIATVLARIPTALLTGHRSQRLPSVASFCFPGTSGESVLLELERKSIICSSGSACAAGSDEPSAVLRAMGIERGVAQTALRFSFGADVTAAALATAAEELVDAVSRILRLGR